MTFKEIYARQDVPVVVINSRSEFVYVNHCFYHVFGWDQEEILGRSLSLIIPKELWDAHNMGMSRFLTTQKPTLLGKPLQLKALDRSGRVFMAEHVIVAEKVEGRWQFAATIIPL